MSVFVQHPDGWIGIPEDFPDGRWATAQDWAAELVDALAPDLAPPGDGDSQRLQDYLSIVAASRAARAASRVYVWVEDWEGPVYVADLVVMGAALLPAGTSLESLAGKDDPDVVEAPIIEPYVTGSGLRGVRSVRYLNPEGADGLVARADYVWPTPDGFVRLYTAQFDMVAFDRSRPRLEALAATVRVGP